MSNTSTALLANGSQDKHCRKSIRQNWNVYGIHPVMKYNAHHCLEPIKVGHNTQILIKKLFKLDLREISGTFEVSYGSISLYLCGKYRQVNHCWFGFRSL